MIPLLFDKNHLQLSKIRAQKKGFESFIFKRLEEDYAERLRLIKREFPKQLVMHTNQIPEKEYDLITSHLRLQVEDDVVGALIQMRHALKADGLFLGTILGGETLRELRLAFLEAEHLLNLPHTPHILPFIDVKTAGNLLQRAGFTLPVVESEVITLQYRSLMQLFEDLRRMGATNCLHARARHFMPRQLFSKMLEIYHAQFSNPDGKSYATLEIIHLSGWSAHESQQKPLARGSVPQGFQRK